MLKLLEGKSLIGVVIASLSVLVIINIIIWGIFERIYRLLLLQIDMDKIRTITFSEMKTHNIL